jgi:HSP20 family molecular chaperone IbpA
MTHVICAEPAARKYLDSDLQRRQVMKLFTPNDQLWRARHLKVTAMKPIERDRRVSDAVAQRALQSCEGHSFAPGHQTKAWENAKSEMLCPLDCGFLTLDDRIELTTDAMSFGEGEIEICAEPQRVTLCGAAGTGAERHPIFRHLELPFPIDPSKVKARFKGGMLTIDLPKARGTPEAAKGKSAA